MSTRCVCVFHVLMFGLAPFAALTAQQPIQQGSTGQPSLTVQVAPSATAMVGRRLSEPPSVRVINADGRPAEGVLVRAAVQGASDQQPFSATAVSDRDGIARFADLYFSGTPRTARLSFVADGFSPTPVLAVDIRAPQADRVGLLEGVSSDYEVATPMTPRFFVESQGQPLADALVRVRVVKGAGMLTGALARTNSDGVAIFDNLRLDVGCDQTGCPEQELVAEVSAGTSMVMASPFRIKPQPTRPKKMLFVSTPAEVAAGGDVLVQLRLRGGPDSNRAAAAVPVRLISAETGMELGRAISDAQGDVILKGSGLQARVGKVRLIVEPELLAPQSFEVDVRRGAPMHLSILRQPSREVLSDSAFATQPAVRVTDAGGNPIPGVQVVTTLCTLTPLQFDRGLFFDKIVPASQDRKCDGQERMARLSGAAELTTDANGEATFKDLVLSGGPNQYVLVFYVKNAPRAVEDTSAIIDYSPRSQYDRSYVAISAIKTVAGVAPEDEFFDVRFRFRLSRSWHVLAAADVALSNRDSDDLNSKQSLLNEGQVTLNYGWPVRSSYITGIPERGLFLGAQAKIFNTVPYYGGHLGMIELGGSPFQGSTATFGFVRRVYRYAGDSVKVGERPVIQPGDANPTMVPEYVHVSKSNLLFEVFLRSSSIDFFKLLTIRGSVLWPMSRSDVVTNDRVTTRLTIAIPVGKLELF